MRTVPPSVKRWYAAQPVDFRLGFDGLFRLVQSRLAADPMGGHLLMSPSLSPAGRVEALAFRRRLWRVIVWVMDALRHGPHSAFSIHLHLVWVTKYRKPSLAGAVGVRVRDLIREICGTLDVHITRGHVSKDHVHLLVSIPPQVAVSRLAQRLKGKSADKLLGEYPHLRKEFWGRHLWARGYFCRSSGQVTDEVVKEYIENQGRGGDGEFRVDGPE